MRKFIQIIIALFIAHASFGRQNTQHFGLEPGPRPVANIGFDHNFRFGFGINNFGFDYSFGVRFIDRFSIGAGVGIKSIKAPIFTSLGLQQEPKIQLTNFPLFLQASVNAYQNGNFKVYGYGIFGRAFYNSNANHTSDKSVKSIYAEVGIGAKWIRNRSMVGIALGQSYTNPKGTARIDYLDSDAYVDYNLEIFNLSLNLTYTIFF
jgi:hypothetical protein